MGYRTELFKTQMCRISYAQGLVKPRAQQDGGTEKYSVTLIYPKDAIAELQAAVKECIVGEWDDKGVDRFKKGLIKNPILEGDGKQAHDKDGNLKAGLGPDVVFIRVAAGKEYQPKVFGPDRLPMDGAEIKSGWWGYPVLNAYAWHHPTNGDGVSFGISMWQHVKEDEVIGGGGGGGNPDDFFSNETVDTSGDGETGSGGAADLFD